MASSVDFPPWVKNVNVSDLDEGKEVSLIVETPTLRPDDKVRLAGNFHNITADARARAVAIVAAGFANKGFLRTPSVNVSSPTLERRTEIVDKNRLNETRFEYRIHVNPGPILE